MSTLALEVYDGHTVPIRRTDTYVNATALCKANGKLVGDYLRLQTTQEFLVALEGSMGIPIDVLVQVYDRGQNHERGTWVHPRVAYNMAQWCNSRAAVWVTDVLERLRRDGVVMLGAPAHEAFFRQIIRAELQPVKTDLEGLRALFVSDIAMKRKPLSAATKRIHRHALRSPAYSSMCPACPRGTERRVFDGSRFLGEWDHFSDRNDARPEATWGICEPCHLLKTTDPAYRDELRGAFQEYQRTLKRLRLVAIKAPSRPALPDVQRQGDLFA